jgi:hypothetical protein
VIIIARNAEVDSIGTCVTLVTAWVALTACTPALHAGEEKVGMSVLVVEGFFVNLNDGYPRPA